MMHLEYRLSKRDFVSAALLAERKGPLDSAVKSYFPFFFGILWAGCYVYVGIRSHHMGVGDLISFLFGPFYIAFVIWMQGGRSRRIYRKSPELSAIQQLDADATGLRVTTPNSEIRNGWKIYAKLAENSRVFVVLQTDHRIFTAIPKKGLSEQQIVELRSLISSNLARR